MCIKKLEEDIKKEKNVTIRERHESRIERIADTILAILLGGVISGSIFSGIKDIHLWIIIIVTVILLLAGYFFFENVFLEKYHKYTDELIRRERNARK